MHISIIGTGYVGLVSGACFAELGHKVTCVDIDEKKIEGLKNGIIPIYEPGLKDLVQKNLSKERLHFTTNAKEAIQSAEVVFSAVGTPPDKDHKADLKYVKQVAITFAQSIEKYTILVTKSTVPVGTNQECQEIINEELKKRRVDVPFDVVSNPEFLREGSAIQDTMYPDRIVVGTDSEPAKEMMKKLYDPLTTQNKTLLLFTSRPSAEIIKYAANSLLATKISFINEVANFCELTGGDITEVAKGIGLDERIGARFLHAGIGYGGSCFPKDVQALIQKGRELEYNFSILEAVEARNASQKELLAKKLEDHFGTLKGKTFAIWGLAFKPKTDDIRCAPSLVIIKKLLEKGAIIKCFDPVAMENIKREIGNTVTFCEKAYDCTEGADALLLLTEWDEFRSLDYKKLKASMKERVIFDGRNIYNPSELKKEGFSYVGIGRKTT